MPLWRTFPGVWQVDSAAALGAGLSCRLLAAAVADTWSWLQDGGVTALDAERVSEIGMSSEREQQVLASMSPEVRTPACPADNLRSACPPAVLTSCCGTAWYERIY
jgi:hypothetical protein